MLLWTHTVIILTKLTYAETILNFACFSGKGRQPTLLNLPGSQNANFIRSYVVLKKNMVLLSLVQIIDIVCVLCKKHKQAKT